MIGTRLSHYRIVAELGAGAMGVVYKAQDEQLPRFAALKIIRPELLGDPELRSRFLREADAAAKVSHPFIATVYEAGETADTTFIAMEYVEGRTLRSLLAASPLPMRDVMRMAIEIAEGLARAHEAHVIHRDLKPDNIIVQPDGHVKILDFGLAKLVEERDERAGSTFGGKATVPVDLTVRGQILGTPAYMSPEQARGLQVDPRSDVFAFGSVLYEMTTGTAPFRGPTYVDTLTSILHSQPRLPTQLRGEVPAELDWILGKCLAKDPAERYQSTRELVVDLKRLQGEIEGRASGDRAFHLEPALEAAQRPPRQVPTNSRRKLAVGLAAALAVAGSAGMLRQQWSRQSASRAALQGRITSLAVLPLANLSGDPEQEYFAEGMTEQMLTALAQISALRVISRTSVMKYKGTLKSVPEIGRELGVDAVIEGSVQRSGDRVRVTAQLIDARTDRHLWARSYERDLTEVLKLESELSLAIAKEIAVEVSADERARFASVKSVNPEAYEAYVLGRFYLNKRSADGMKRAIDLFERAIRMDPDYAPPYAGVADVYELSASYGFLPRVEARSKARDAALQAIAIDEGLAAAHASLGLVLSGQGDRRSAEREFKRALEIDPNCAPAHQWYANGVLVPSGRLDEACAEMERARQLDPLSLIINTGVGFNLYRSRRYAEAAQQLQKVLDMDPEFNPAKTGLMDVYIVQGRFDKAIEQYQEIPPDYANGLISVARACALSGQRSEALRTLKSLQNASAEPEDLAKILVALGEKKQALGLLERAQEPHAPGLVTFEPSDPAWDPIRSEPRFGAVVRREQLR